MSKALHRMVLLLVLAAIGGCGGAGSATITRRVGGEERTGIFVSPFSYEHFVRGELAYVSGDLARAADEYELARAGPEDDPLLIARLAEVRDRMGHEREALALLHEGEALDRDSELLWLTRGRIAERHGRVDEALDAYSRAASAAARSEEGPLALAALLRAQGREEQADAVLERYLARAEGAGAARARLALAVERGDAQAAAEAVRSLLAVAPARADEVRAAVRAALDADQPEVAERLAAALPDDEVDRELRLRAALAAGDRDRAEGLLARWMPDSPSELLEVARGYLSIGMPDRAEELARVAIASDAGADARLVLGRALEARGDLGESAAVLAHIEPGSGAWPDGPIELGRALRAAGRPALAAEILAIASARRGAVPLAIALSDARAEAGDGAGALAALEGDDVRLRGARAHLLDRLGRVREASDAYTALPVDDRALEERVRVRASVESLWRRGEHEAALRALEAWIDRAPEDLLARARYAELLAASNEGARAREIASAALPLAVEPTLRRRLSALVAGPSAPRAESSD